MPARRRQLSNGSWSSPRTPTTSTSAPPVPSPAGPTPASRSRTASAPAAKPAGFDRSVPRPTMVEIREAEQRAAAKVVGVTDVTLPRLSRRPPRVDARPAARHQPRDPPGAPAAGRRASRPSATSSASTPATPTTSPRARRRWPRSTRTPATRSPTPSCSTRGFEPWAVGEMYIVAAGTPDVVRRHHRHVRAQDRRAAVPREPASGSRRPRRAHPGLERGQRRARRTARGPSRRVVPPRRHDSRHRPNTASTRGSSMELQGLRLVAVGGASGMAKATAERVVAGGGEGRRARPRRERRALRSRPRSAGTFHQCDVTDFEGTEARARGRGRGARRRSTSRSTPPAAAIGKRTLSKDGPHAAGDVPAGRRPQPDRARSTSTACRRGR